MSVTENNIRDLHHSLALRAGDGDTRAQFELYELYNRAMYNSALRIVKNPELAEELMQDGFLAAFNNLKQWKGNSTFGAWLKRIVINECLNYLKKKKIEMIPLEETREPVEPSPDFEPGEEDVVAIKKAVGQLPDGYRLVLSLYLFEGYDHDEIAKILNISGSTSRTQYIRAKKKLVELINQNKRYVRQA